VGKPVSASGELLIDLGHSRAKWALARAGRIDPQSFAACPLDDWQALGKSLRAQGPGRVWVSAQSHATTVERLFHLAAAVGVSLCPVQTGMVALPVRPAYPELGSDRWLAMQACWQEQAAAFCLIDLGSAITFDLVDDRARHLGGWIMAGRQALAASLHAAAGSLPAAAGASPRAAQPERTTAQAIAGGLDLQLIGGIERALNVAGSQLGKTPQVWLTGGDAGWVSDRLGRPVRHDRLLVLKGLAMVSGQ